MISGGNRNVLWPIGPILPGHSIPLFLNSSHHPTCIPAGVTISTFGVPHNRYISLVSFHSCKSGLGSRNSTIAVDRPSTYFNTIATDITAQHRYVSTQALCCSLKAPRRRRVEKNLDIVTFKGQTLAGAATADISEIVGSITARCYRKGAEPHWDCAFSASRFVD